MVDPPRWPLGGHPDGWPTVSVVMPVRNEAAGLEAAVESVLAQQYPRPFEVCLAVGPSDDDTEAIADRLAAKHPRVGVVRNPSGTTPSGLNAAIRATTGEVVVRVDGHARLAEGYVRRAVETLAMTGAVNVGGLQDAIGETRFERAVAAAQRSWLGTGGARYRVGGAPGPVDTVYLGVYRRNALEEAGLFDERLTRNQDYELNVRLRGSGGLVWFDPALHVRYRPRGTVTGLWTQYYEYGYWKFRVLSMHPRSARPRQVGPLVVALVLLTAFVHLERAWARITWLGYLGTCAGTVLRRTRTLRVAILGSVAVPTMHLAWATGFIAAAVTRGPRAWLARRGADGAKVPAADTPVRSDDE